MEMVATAEVGMIGGDLTPPLSPLAFSLHDSFRMSHCASCFSPLPPDPLNRLFYYYYYCSPSCSSSLPPLHLHHLLRLSQNPPPFNGETSDLRVALLLLLHIKRHQPPFIEDYDRICGLMANRHKLLVTPIDTADDEFSLSTRIKKGARAIAVAMDSDDHEYLLEEAVLCVVVTNAVEVQDRLGRSVGIAVYDIPFSWINHSCSPNACYRFLPPNTDTHTGGQQCLIRPASSNGIEISDFPTGWREIYGGPRIVVRSIKHIKKGEQVTIAYTDLLQPRESRQLELWSKYRFTCCCGRCVAMPLTYVDHCLQQVSTSSASGKLLINDVGADGSLKEYVDDAIHDYLSLNDAESCCKKLENVLVNGFLYKQEQVVIRLHPQHHLSLNAYATLASAYKVRATAMDGNASDLKISAAYSLLLALLTHPFFLSESCLIACVSHFWIGAGESLLNLARSLKVSGSELPSLIRCSKCGLTEAFELADFSKEVSSEFLNCSIASSMAPKLWELLIRGNGYLEAIRDPTMGFFSNNNQNLDLEQGVDEEVFVFQVGVHCLSYGGILSNIYGGHDSHFSCYVRRLLYGN